MSEEKRKNIADRLIGAERDEDHSPVEAALDPTIGRLLETELRFEERARRVAVLSWATAFVCLVLFAISFYIMRTGGGILIEVTRSAIVVISLTGIVSLLAAAVTSIRLLFRPRTPTLRVIERRLAALEKLLMKR